MSREIVVHRSFAAPRMLVFDAWTNAEHLDRWMGPRGFVTTTISLDFRVGGEWNYWMRHAEYGEFRNRIRYREVVPGERLVYEHDAGVDGDPNGFVVTVTFKEVAGRTELTFHTVFHSEEAAERGRQIGAKMGGQQTFDRLEEALEEDAKQDLILVRNFKAPRDLVWKCWTEAKHLEKWWGPKGLSFGVESLDLRPGGVFHYSMSMGTMKMYGKFVYIAIEEPERLVFTSGFSDENQGVTHHPMAPDWPAEIHNTAIFTEENGETTVTLRGRPIRATAAERRVYANNHPNMQQGFAGTYEKLDAYLLEIAAN